MLLRLCRILLLFCCITPLFAQKLDVLIRNGSVLDGSGSPARLMDIGIRGDRIVVLAKHVMQPADRVIDARGLVVAPGFSDRCAKPFALASKRISR